MTITLQQVNQASAQDAPTLLDGLYEHSPWIAAQALEARPFNSLAQLKYAMTTVLKNAGKEVQLDLIRRHPELAGKAMISQGLTVESTNEQNTAGLTQCTAAC